MTKRSHVCTCLSFGLCVSFAFLACVVVFVNDTTIAQSLQILTVFMVWFELSVIAGAFWILRKLDVFEEDIDTEHQQLLPVNNVELTIREGVPHVCDEGTGRGMLTENIPRQRRCCCLSSGCIYIGVVCNAASVMALLLIWNVV